MAGKNAEKYPINVFIVLIFILGVIILGFSALLIANSIQKLSAFQFFIIAFSLFWGIYALWLGKNFYNLFKRGKKYTTAEVMRDLVFACLFFGFVFVILPLFMFSPTMTALGYDQSWGFTIIGILLVILGVYIYSHYKEK